MRRLPVWLLRALAACLLLAGHLSGHAAYSCTVTAVSTGLIYQTPTPHGHPHRDRHVLSAVEGVPP